VIEDKLAEKLDKIIPQRVGENPSAEKANNPSDTESGIRKKSKKSRRRSRSSSADSETGSSDTETQKRLEAANAGLRDALQRQDTYSMKFPKPRKLLPNDYPDSALEQPLLLRALVQEMVYPAEGTPLSKYIESSVAFLKEQKRKRAKKLAVKVAKPDRRDLGRHLYFVTCSPFHSDKFQPAPFRALVDTGAANSLIHTSVVNRLGVPYQPIKLSLATATGTDDTAVQGLLHMKFGLRAKTGRVLLCCTTFVVTTRLNGMQAIIGAEFLMDNDAVSHVSKKSIGITVGNDLELVAISPVDYVAQNDGVACGDSAEILQLTCQGCGNKNGHRATTPIYDTPLVIRHTSWTQAKTELGSTVDTLELDSYYRCEKEQELQPLDAAASGHQAEELNTESWGEIPTLSHVFKEPFQNETLPPSEEAFGSPEELKFEVLDKSISLDDADYSGCPPEWYKPLRALLDDFHDRFSKKKLDIEITDKYEADLKTLPG
jgi:hypothetical protein